MEPKVPEDIYKTHLENKGEKSRGSCPCSTPLLPRLPPSHLTSPSSASAPATNGLTLFQEHQFILPFFGFLQEFPVEWHWTLPDKIWLHRLWIHLWMQLLVQTNFSQRMGTSGYTKTRNMVCAAFIMSDDIGVCCAVLCFVVLCCVVLCCCTVLCHWYCLYCFVICVMLIVLNLEDPSCLVCFDVIDYRSIPWANNWHFLLRYDEHYSIVGFSIVVGCWWRPNTDWQISVLNRRLHQGLFVIKSNMLNSNRKQKRWLPQKWETCCLNLVF